MVLNKRSIEGSTNISDGVSLKNKHIHHYADENEFYKATNQESSSSAQEPDIRFGKVKLTKGSGVDSPQSRSPSLNSSNSNISKSNNSYSNSKSKDQISNNTTNTTASNQKNKSPSFKFTNNRTLVNTIGVFMFVYYLAMMYVRFEHRGIVGIADSLWLCNLAVIFGFVSIFLNNPYIMNIAVDCTLIVHLLWVIDVVVWLTTGSFPLGNAEYISWPTITWGEILTTTHHAWYVPLCMLCLHRNGGYQDKVWIGSMYLVVPVLYLSRLFPRIIDLPNGTTFYLNINMSHEWWSDMNGWPFSLIPKETFQYYIFLYSFSFVLFSVSHAVMKVVCYLTIKK